MNLKTVKEKRKEKKRNLSATFSNAPYLDFQYKKWDFLVLKNVK
jgi:hypothetical protein